MDSLTHTALTDPAMAARQEPAGRRAGSPDPASTTPFMLADRHGALVGHGVGQALPEVTADRAATAVSACFASAYGSPSQRVVVGALPFDDLAPVHLYQPREISRVPASEFAIHPVPEAPARQGEVEPWRFTAEPTPEIFAGNVARALEALDSMPELRKVVLARRLTLHSRTPIDVRAVLARLQADPGVTTYCVPLPPESPAGLDVPGRDRVLVGATPELLIERRGRGIRSRPLAGSARRGLEADADRIAGEGLLRSSKDLHEHAVVVEMVADLLAPYCSELRVPSRPALVSTASMWHLATGIEGELRSDSVSSVELAALLHPTPAVCGMPVAQARAVITQLEPFGRGFYAGAVGWCDASGDGRWMVALRCAEISGGVARLHAGAGIVPGSDPDEETAETTAKFSAMLAALGARDDSLR